MKKLFKLSFFIAIICSLGIISQSCKTLKNTDAKSSANNINGTWVLKSFNGEEANKLFTRKLPTLIIDQKAGEVSGFGGCNSFSGKFVYENNLFSASNLISTMMYCDDAKQEPQILKVLAEANNVTVTNGILTFKQKGKTVAEFVSGIDAKSLKGKWTLAAINGKDISSLFESSRYPNIEFLPKENKISGNAGCNHYNATYQLDGSIITVGPIASTRMACQHMNGEYQFIDALSETSNITVLNNTITFSKAGKETLKFVKK